MAETNGRTVVTGETPIEAAGQETGEPEPFESAAETRAIDTALERFSSAVDREVDECLTDDEILIRFERVRQQVERWSDDPRQRRQVDDLVAYAYGIVRLWLRLVTARGGHQVGLAQEDINELAEETVAQAVSAFDNAPPAGSGGRVVFLARCLSRLPRAYRRWRLRGGAVELDELAALARTPAAGDALVADLRRYVTSEPAATADLMRSWDHTTGDGEDAVAVTLEALRIADDITDRT